MDRNIIDLEMITQPTECVYAFDDATAPSGCFAASQVLTQFEPKAKPVVVAIVTMITSLPSREIGDWILQTVGARGAQRLSINREEVPLDVDAIAERIDRLITRQASRHRH